MEDVSKYPVLFAELIRWAWSDADSRKLARENFTRAFARAESAARLRQSRAASRAVIEELGRRAVP